MLLILAVVFLVVLGGGSFGLLTFANKQQHRRLISSQSTETVSEKQAAAITSGHVRDMIRLDSCIDGIIKSGAHSYYVARLVGTNFSVISENEQEAREDAIIGIVNNIDYPVKFISNTVVSDMDVAINRVQDFVGILDPEKPYAHSLSAYANMYISVLENMRTSRKVLSNQSWIALEYSGNDNHRQVLIERMELLKESLRSTVGIILEPVDDEVKVLDVIHQVMLPERVHKPSDQLNIGSGEFLHTSERDHIRLTTSKGVA